MLLEEIGSTLWNLDLFQSTRVFLENSVVIGKISKIFSCAVDGAILGALLLGGIFLIQHGGWDQGSTFSSGTGFNIVLGATFGAILRIEFEAIKGIWNAIFKDQSAKINTPNI